MSQQPTNHPPVIEARAKGMNDEDGLGKTSAGYDVFALNALATGDVKERRSGRDMSFVVDGSAVRGIWPLSWADGLRVIVGAIGTSWYDFTNTYTFLFDTGVKLIIQSADGNYWDCTPDASTEIINPIVVSTPSATAQTANRTISYGQLLGFEVTNGTVRLNADQNHWGWFLQKDGFATTPTNLVTTDWVFTIASGFSLRIVDKNGNSWKLGISNNGNLTATTV